MKRIPKMQILVWVLAIVPIILTAVFYPRLPASIPMQWDFGGQVGYEPKWHLFIIAALAPLFAILFPLIPENRSPDAKAMTNSRPPICCSR